MAAAATINRERDLGGGVKMIVGTLAMDSSYPTNGETVDLSAYFPGGTVHGMFFNPSLGYVLEHDGGAASTGKVLAYYADYDAVADGALIEVPNTTDISAIVGAMFVAFGE